MPPTTPPAAKPRFSYDYAFQMRMLRTLFQDQDFACSVSGVLAPDHFTRHVHRWAAKTILDYANTHGAGIGLDAVKILRDRALHSGRLLPKDKTEIDSLIDKLEHPVKDKSFIKEELFHFVKNQAIREMILNSLDFLEVQDFEAIDKEMAQALAIQTSLTGGLGHFFVRDMKARSTARKATVKNGIPSGLVGLDKHMKPGGLWPKALGSVIAPTGKGKSHVLVHIGKSAVIATGGECKVLHVTLELSERSVCDRYDAAFSNVSLNDLEDRIEDVERAVDEYGTRYGEFLVVKEFPSVTLTVPALRAYIRQLERVAFYPGLILVDYADEMLPSIETDSAYEGMGNVYRELRKLAFDLNVPIWTASQTQRAALKAEVIDLDSIADSFQKAMVSDVVIALCQTDKEKRMGHARFFVCKNREGMDKFAFNVKLDWTKSTIRSL